MRKITITFILFIVYYLNGFSQAVPSSDEKFPFLCTFGKNASKEWGDDDFNQTFFFVVPQTEKNPIYIRIFDADIGGKNDEMHGGGFNTKIKYMVFGGKGAHSDPDAKKQNPVGNYKSGIQLASKIIGNDSEYDDKWFTLGPFNPSEGELQTENGGYVFKIIIDGLDGDDGNLYKMFLSYSSTENKPVEGGNAFAYEYSLRMSNVKGSVGHLYPFITPNVIAVKIFVFDFDNDGIIRIVSVAKKGVMEKSSGNDEWIETKQLVVPEEINTSYDLQFIKQTNAKDNNIVVYITNQYGELMPFYTAPIGGVPKFKYKIGVKPTK